MREALSSVYPLGYRSALDDLVGLRGTNLVVRSVVLRLRLQFF